MSSSASLFLSSIAHWQADRLTLFCCVLLLLCADLKAYISLPADVKKCCDSKSGSGSGGSSRTGVIILNDIFGWNLPNNREVADFLASQGFITLLPDLFHGDPFVEAKCADALKQNLGGPPPAAPAVKDAKVMAAFTEFQSRHPVSAVAADIDKCVKYLRATDNTTHGHGGCSQIGVIGFCWGGRMVSELAQSATPGFDCVVSCYGSRMELANFSKITKPVCFIFGGADAGIPQPQTADAIRGLIPSMKVPVEVTVYPDRPHGFMHRFDVNDKPSVSASTDAFKQAVNWFQKYMNAPAPTAAAGSGGAGADSKSKGPVQPCCLGFLHNVTPTGVDTEIDGPTAGSKLKLYVSHPPTPAAAGATDSKAAAGAAKKNKLVIIINDIFGFQLPNNREVCDYIASRGYIAALPDVFRGDVWPHDMAAIGKMTPEERGAAFQKWNAAHPVTDVAADIASVVKAMRAKLPASEEVSIGLIGFCWGARALSELVKARELGIKAAVACYGSNTALDKLVDITAPTLFIYGDKDASIPQPATADTIRSLIPSIKVAVDVTVHPGMPHGFVHRFDPKDKAAVDASNAAWTQTFAWYDKYL